MIKNVLVLIVSVVILILLVISCALSLNYYNSRSRITFTNKDISLNDFKEKTYLTLPASVKSFSITEDRTEKHGMSNRIALINPKFIKIEFDEAGYKEFLATKRLDDPKYSTQFAPHSKLEEFCYVMQDGILQYGGTKYSAYHGQELSIYADNPKDCSYTYQEIYFDDTLKPISIVTPGFASTDTDENMVSYGTFQDFDFNYYIKVIKGETIQVFIYMEPI
ncbi:MAG: hypothetical protein ABI721_00635 [Candidatus Dojkabacteria bacterium]